MSKRPLKRSSRPYEIGDSVKVKKGTIDPDFGFDIGNWQGRVTEYIEPDDEDETDETLINIEWDSVTLKKCTKEYILKCEQDGFDYFSINLGINDVEKATARDTEDDVEMAHEEIETKYRWAFLGEQGTRIQTVLDTANQERFKGEFEAWEVYLKGKLKFPFKAEVFDVQVDVKLKEGDEVTVTGLSAIDEDLGVMVKVQMPKKKDGVDFPLSDLEMIEESDANFIPIDDYLVWFSHLE